MKMCLSGAQPGHDYYNVTQTVFELMHLPGDCASWATPLVGIPLLFGAAYFTAGMFMSGINKLKKTENENGHPNGVE